MSLAKLSSLFLVLTLSNLACAEDPNPVVPKDGLQQGQEEEHSEIKAVIFSGKLLEYNPITKQLEPSEKPCTLQVSMLEEEEDGTHEHAHHMVAQIAEKIDGENLPAIELEPYYLDIAQKNYVETAPTKGKYIPTLIGMEIKENAGAVDVNSLDQYMTDLTLVQSFHLEFNQEMDFEAMEEALEETLESKEKDLTAANVQTLDQMFYSTVRVEHIGHYDQVFCSQFKLQTETALVEFEFEGHEHEKEHGHEH